MNEPDATSTDAESAEALLERIAAGSEAALEAFYRLTHQRVYAFTLKRVGDPAVAADILNDVMLQVWHHAGRFEGRSRAMTWVLGIAHHKVMDALRRRGREDRHEELDDSIPDEDSAGGIDAVAGVEDASAVRRCLEKLSDAHRTVVHLAFFEDLSYAEIADIAGCPLGTVKTRMMHAKNALKRCLQALGAAG